MVNKKDVRMYRCQKLSDDGSVAACDKLQKQSRVVHNAIRGESSELKMVPILHIFVLHNLFWSLKKKEKKNGVHTKNIIIQKLTTEKQLCLVYFS